MIPSPPVADTTTSTFQQTVACFPPDFDVQIEKDRDVGMLAKPVVLASMQVLWSTIADAFLPDSPREQVYPADRVDTVE